MNKLYYIERPKAPGVRSIYLSDAWINYSYEPANVEWNTEETSYFYAKWTSLPEKAEKFTKDEAEACLKRYMAFVTKRSKKHLDIKSAEYEQRVKDKAKVDAWAQAHGREPEYNECKNIGVHGWWDSTWRRVTQEYNDAKYHHTYGSQVKIITAQEGIIDFDKKYINGSKRFKWCDHKFPTCTKCQSCGAKIPGGSILSINGQYMICAFCVQLLMKDLDKHLAHIPEELHKEWKKQIFMKKL